MVWIPGRDVPSMIGDLEYSHRRQHFTSYIRQSEKVGLYVRSSGL